MPTISRASQEAFQSFLEAYKPKKSISSSSNNTPIKELTLTTSITPKSSYNFMNIASNLLETSTPEQRNHKVPLLKDFSSKKVFGILPKEVFEDVLEDKDWQTRSSAIELIDQVLQDLEGKSVEFLPHLTDFLRLLVRLLQDNNFKICLTTVNIISRLLVFREIRRKENLEILYPRLLDKLGDSKIAIRQASFKIIKELFDSSNSLTPATFFLDTLLPCFESVNQHIREESLNLLSYFLTKATIEESYFERLLLLVLRFLEDLKLKVKMAALEVLSSIEKRLSRSRFEAILKQELTIEGFEMVMSKFPIEIATEIIEKMPINYINKEIKINNIENGKKRPTFDGPKDFSTSKTFKTTQNYNIKDPSGSFHSNAEKKPEKRTPITNSLYEISTSCSSRSENKPFVVTVKKEEEKRALSAFSLKTSAVSEELEKINENRSDSSEKSIEKASGFINTENSSRENSVKPIKRELEVPVRKKRDTINTKKDFSIEKKDDVIDKRSLKKAFSREESVESSKTKEKDPILYFQTEKDSFKPKPRERPLAKTEKLLPPSEKKPPKMKNTLKKPFSSLKEEEKEEILMVQSKEYKEKKDIGSFEEIDLNKTKKRKESGQSTSNFDYKQATYLEKENLKPLKSPENSLKTLIIDLKSKSSLYFRFFIIFTLADDWSRQFDGLNTLRRLIFFHTETLVSNSQQLHSIIIDLMRLIESLRSSLSKNAMLTASEMVERLKKSLDNESELLLTKLIKKGLDSNAFMAEEVKKTLINVTISCSESKIIPALVTMSSTIKPFVGKLNLLVCYEALINKSGPRFLSFRDSEKLLFYLVQFLFDPNNEVRLYSRTIFLSLYYESLDINELDRVLLRVLNEPTYQKLRLFLEKYKNKETTPEKKDMILHQNKLKKSTTPQHPVKGGSKDFEINNFIKKDFNSMKINDNYEEKKGLGTTKRMLDRLKGSKGIIVDQEALGILIQQCNNPDWKIRLEGISNLVDFIGENIGVLTHQKSQIIIIDNFLKLISDSNTKVSLQALKSFKEIIKDLIPISDDQLNMVLNAVFTVLGSFNLGLRSAGVEVLEEIIENVGAKGVFPGLCNGAMFTVAKARPVLIRKLIGIFIIITIINILLLDIIEEIYEEKPALVTKNVCPLIIKLLDENKGDFKALLQKLVEKMHKLMANELFAAFPTGKTSLLSDLLRK